MAPLRSLILLLAAALLLLAPVGHCSPPAIGVVYRHPTTTPGFPSPERVVSALRSAGISHAHLPDPSPTTLRAFLYSDISLLLSLPSSLLAANRSAARRWVASRVLPFHPRARIVLLSIPATSTSTSTINEDLLPAVKNLAWACFDVGLRRIRVTAALPFAALAAGPPLPPSSARFRDPLAVRPLLDHLNATRAPILFDLYPFHLFRSDFAIPAGFALFDGDDAGFRDDPASRLRYQNLFDEMLDAAIVAVRELGYERMQVAVSATGWPTAGAPEATAGFARRYYEGLVAHLRSGQGTPLRREGAAAVYVRELFDDMSVRRGEQQEWERHFGIWHVSNLTIKNEVGMRFSAAGSRCCSCAAVAMAVGFAASAAAFFLLLGWDDDV